MAFGQRPEEHEGDLQEGGTIGVILLGWQPAGYVQKVAKSPVGQGAAEEGGGECAMDHMGIYRLCVTDYIVSPGIHISKPSLQYGGIRR